MIVHQSPFAIHRHQFLTSTIWTLHNSPHPLYLKRVVKRSDGSGGMSRNDVHFDVYLSYGAGSIAYMRYCGADHRSRMNTTRITSRLVRCYWLR
jgi:hypothetical protein